MVGPTKAQDLVPAAPLAPAGSRHRETTRTPAAAAAPTRVGPADRQGKDFQRPVPASEEQLLSLSLGKRRAFLDALRILSFQSYLIFIDLSFESFFFILSFESYLLYPKF